MPLFVVGLNHRTAPIEVRERVAFADEAQREALEALRQHAKADEAVLVSTCNRTEIYLRGDGPDSVDRACAWLAATPAAAASPRLEIAAHCYRHSGESTVRHAFRVASGLDSMVLGEPQILGQVKLSVKVASEARALGGPLNRLFQETFKVAKQVRSETEIGATSINMAAASLKLAQQLFGDLREIKLLLIGVGEMIELAATHFAAHHPRAIVVANRTLERGREFAAKFNAQAITLQQIPERIHEFDAIISSTASSLPIIGKGMIERALKARRHRPMFLVDLAVPRDIEAEVGTLDDVFLYTLDALGKIISQNLAVRESAVIAAEAIIEQRTQEFMRWLDGRSAVPVIQRLRARADRYCESELARAQKLLARGEPPATVIEQLAAGLSNKFLHHPLAALNRLQGAERESLADALEQLYPPESDAADSSETA